MVELTVDEVVGVQISFFFADFWQRNVVDETVTICPETLQGLPALGALACADAGNDRPASRARSRTIDANMRDRGRTILKA
jgi:hypothetical protein